VLFPAVHQLLAVQFQLRQEHRPESFIPLGAGLLQHLGGAQSHSHILTASPQISLSMPNGLTLEDLRQSPSQATLWIAGYQSHYLQLDIRELEKSLTQSQVVIALSVVL